MYELEQHGKENASRLPWMHGALPVVAAASLLLAAQSCLFGQSPTDTLPNAPSALLFFSASVPANANAPRVEGQNALQNPTQNPTQVAPQSPAQNALPLPSTIAAPDTLIPSVNSPMFFQPGQGRAGNAAYVPLPPCPKHASKELLPLILQPATQPTCVDQLQLIVDTGYVKPLSSKQKGVLAVRAVTDPFNLLTIAFFSAVSIAANAHSAYGPGFTGWGRESGYTLGEDIQIEATGVYLIPSIVHQDPRYHRMPGAPVGRRIKHALIHTLVSQHDDGSLMPNYATLINYPLTAEISNLYVPGIATKASATVERVAVGYATDPIDPLIAEFLPDFAKRVHIHIIFAQRILNHIALGSGGDPGAF